MSKTFLSIVDKAYRAVSEEQDDTIVWVHHALKGATAEFSLLLKGNAVNYLDCSQETPGITIGSWKQSHPAQMGGDVESLIKKGVDVYFIAEDLEDRGIDRTNIISSAKSISKKDLPGLLAKHDLVFQW